MSNWLAWLMSPFTFPLRTPHHVQHHQHVPRPDLAVGTQDLPAVVDTQRHKGTKSLTIFWLGVIFLFVVPGGIILWLVSRSLGLFYSP